MLLLGCSLWGVGDNYNYYWKENWSFCNMRCAQMKGVLVEVFVLAYNIMIVLCQCAWWKNVKSWKSCVVWMWGLVLWKEIWTGTGTCIMYKKKLTKNIISKKCLQKASIIRRVDEVVRRPKIDTIRGPQSLSRVMSLHSTWIKRCFLGLKFCSSSFRPGVHSMEVL